MNRLKREHAIETGVIERLYDLKKGITEPFIKKGFVESYLSHDDTNVPTQVLMKHLKDHLDAVRLFRFNFFSVMVWSKLYRFASNLNSFMVFCTGLTQIGRAHV